MVAFSESISQWARATEARATAVYRRSVELLGEEMARTKPQGGRVPFQTGALSRSVVASTEGMPKASNAAPSGSNVGAVAATLRLDQSAWLGWTMSYSRRMNYGFVGADSLGRVYNQAGNYFLEGAIAQWPQIVAQASREIQQGVEAR